MIKKWTYTIVFFAILASLPAPAQVRFDAFLGYDFFPVPYYSPSNERNTYYEYTFFTSRYVFLGAFAPNFGFGFTKDFSEKFSLQMRMTNTIFYMKYDVEDRAKYNYYPFGEINIESWGMQYAILAEWNVSKRKYHKHYIKPAVGLFGRFHLFKENRNQNVIDDILDDFPIGVNNMNSFIPGLTAQIKFGFRYFEIADKSRYCFIGTYLHLNYTGIIARDEYWIPSSGIIMGIDF